MHVKEITEQDALLLCTRDEDHFFDRKALAVSGAKIQKITVAFANTDGGEFVVGIADDAAEPVPAKRWQGAAKIEDFNGVLQALTEVTPSPPVTYEILRRKGTPGLVLKVDVQKSAHVHQTADKVVYVRLGAQSIPVKDAEQINQLGYAKGAMTFEDHVVDAATAEDVVDTEVIRSFLDGYSPKTDPIEFLTNQHLIDDKTWKPRVAGILLFSSNPSAIMPRKCAVKIARYETREEEPDREHLKDVRTIEADAYNLIHQSIRTITDIMSTTKIWTAQGLRPVDYPPETIWEIFVNAIIHRDYSISDDVRVLIFNNRIEIISPGRLPAYVTEANILDTRYTRNPKLVRTLNRYKNPPNKDLGEGLNTAYQKMKERQLKQPELYNEKNWVRVVIPHAPLAKPSEAILDFLKTSDFITNKQAKELTGIRSENKVKTEFYKLRDEGFLEMVPERKGSASAWQLTEQGRGELGLGPKVTNVDGQQEFF